MHLLKLALVIAMVTLKAHASTCSDPTWVAEPEMSDGKFKGELTGVCRIAVETAPDLRRLVEYFEAEIEKSVVTTFESRVPDTELLPGGRRWDLLIKVKEGKIRNNFQLASDGKDLLIYQTRSKEIKFGGLAGYLKKLNVKVVVRRVSDREVTLKLNSLTWIDKPLVAPSGTFYNIAIKNSLKQFTQELESVTEKIKNNL